MKRLGTLLMTAIAVSGFSFVAWGANAAPKPHKPRALSVAVWQDTDSARYAVSWDAPIRGPRHLPIAFYRTRVVRVNDTLAANSTPSLRDTLAIAYPPVFQTIDSLRVLVQAVDTVGASSNYTSSGMFQLTTAPLPPGDPGNVTVDSSLINSPVAAVHVRPSMVEVVVGDTTRLCAILVLENGVSGLAANSDFPFCHEMFDRWVLEVEG